MPGRAASRSVVKDRLARKCQVESQFVEDAYICTNLQASLIAASLQNLGDYLSQFVFNISSFKGGEVDTTIKHACETLYKQTPILRSRVIENGGQFLQVVVHEPLQWFESTNLQGYLTGDKQRSVALGAPLATFGWVVEPTGNSYMVWSLHHCQYDEQSFQLLLEDLNGIISSGKTPPSRPTFAKFIKALSKIDIAASHKFWKTKLEDAIHCSPIFRARTSHHFFRTSSRLERTLNIEFSPSSKYTPPVLAVAAWSLVLSHLSASSCVLFGHVLNGRTSDLEGIEDICGPTLATVPWLVKLPFHDTVKDLLEQVQELRSDILPYEQTALDEYRKLVGRATFDTLLSVRFAQHEDDPATMRNYLRPEKSAGADLNHPCCIFLEVEIVGHRCSVKASYDSRYINHHNLNNILDKFVSAVDALPRDLAVGVDSFYRSLQLPACGQPATGPAVSQAEDSVDEDEHAATDVDPKIMRKIQKLVLDTVKTRDPSSIGPRTTLTQLGMDSLQSVVLSRHINKAFTVSLPFREITGHRKTLCSIGKAVQDALDADGTPSDTASKVSIIKMAESYTEKMRSMVGPSTGAQQDENSTHRAILLTGATGYLGVEILRQLLTATLDRIVLLVRCRDASHGLQRLTRVAETAAWKHGEIASINERVDIWPADLAEERLGLSSDHWLLLQTIAFRAIIHNGAKVDFVHNYSGLEAANVRSTAVLLEAHIKSQLKSNFVFVTGGRPCPVGPEDIEETAEKLSTAPGYAQTKLTSEILIHKTMELYKNSGHEVRMSIVHPGSIIGSASTGVANTDDFIWRYVAASHGMGCYVPAVPTKRSWMNLTPVDWVASEIVSRALTTGEDASRPANTVDRCLLRGGLPVSQFWSVIVNLSGNNETSLQPVSEWEWLAEFEDDLNQKNQNQPLFALSQLLLQGQLAGIGGLPPEIDARTGLMPDTQAAEAALRSNVQYLVDNGFIYGDTQPSRNVFVRSKR